MKQKLVIMATIALPDDPLAASKLQTAALEAGEAFKKSIMAVDKKAEYDAKVQRVRPDDAPPRKKAGTTAGTGTGTQPTKDGE